MSRVSKQDFWGDPTFPQVFRACGTDPYFGSQCLAGVSNGSSVNVSLCSEVTDLQREAFLSGPRLRVPLAWLSASEREALSNV